MSIIIKNLSFFSCLVVQEVLPYNLLKSLYMLLVIGATQVSSSSHLLFNFKEERSFSDRLN